MLKVGDKVIRKRSVDPYEWFEWLKANKLEEPVKIVKIEDGEVWFNGTGGAWNLCNYIKQETKATKLCLKLMTK